MTLSEMRQVLDESGVQLTRSLGQNFLHDGNQLRRITAASNLSHRDKVLEIGPGLGPLTELLIEQAGEVRAIETDARLVNLVRQRFESASNLRLLHADALRYLKTERCDWSEWKLVSNLPYSVASPILVELAGVEHPPARMVVTLQLEVAQRLMASPGSKDYGVLSLLVQLRFEPSEMFKIPAGCFFPQPDVDSACVTLVRRSELLLPRALEPAFRRLVKMAFSQRRKMMFKLLKAAWTEEKIRGAFETLGLSGRERAESVSLAQFVKLTVLLES